MSFTALVCDSTAALPQEFVEKHGVSVIPLYLKVGDVTYRDRVDISAEEFYQRLPSCNPLPTTSQPSAGDFVALYQDLVERGATGIISIHLSAGISGTINSATLAAAEIDSVPIEIVDTESTSVAVMFAVEAGVWALEAGATMEEALIPIRRVVEQQKLVFSVDTLEYLYKGGRIGGAAALVGSLLQFKPLLYFSEGKIDALERVRTSKRALVRMAELLADWMGSEEPVRVGVIEADCPDRGQALAELARQHMNVADLGIHTLTPVLGAHGGNGTVGLCCCPLSAFQWG
ncbi:MAG: hypothetical protein A2Y73_04690 [Chloroflexi bacterium RBG_13_56_8]|nr:MAG: hypothetical protein A2Y73_04690 [Chloroflexi bacterium RBG_13_56_8]